ncbi:MAG: glycosyltransferase family 9 protein [Nitrospira sp.]|nr:glycosyltransferase family 9 protein [Nitrospira sp.]
MHAAPADDQFAVSRFSRARILLIKPSSLGDIVHAMPVASAIKTAWPEAHLTWVVKRRWSDLVERIEGVDRVWPVDETVRSWIEQARRLRAERFDLAIDLQGLFRSGALAWFSGAPARIGFANAREGSPWFYTMRVPVSTSEMHAVDRYLLVAQSLDIRSSGTPRFSFTVFDRDMEIIRDVCVREGLSIDRPWIAVNVSARWPTKRWSLDSFAEVVDRLQGEGLGQVVVIGGAGDRSDAEQLRAVAGSPFIDFTGKIPLGCLPAFLSKAALLITNDSGPMHIAAAVGCRVIALFGPTSEIRTGPYGQSHHVLTKSVPCRPCFSRVCRHEPELECLRRTEPGEVVEAARRAIDGSSVSP